MNAVSLEGGQGHHCGSPQTEYYQGFHADPPVSVWTEFSLQWSADHSKFKRDRCATMYQRVARCIIP